MAAQKPRHHFLTIEEDNGKTYLIALPGQTIGRRHITSGILVKGCYNYRSKFPAGTLFGTTSLKERLHNYEVTDLYCLNSEAVMKDKEKEETRQTLIKEYTEKFLTTVKS